MAECVTKGIWVRNQTVRQGTCQICCQEGVSSVSMSNIPGGKIKR